MLSAALYHSSEHLARLCVFHFEIYKLISVQPTAVTSHIVLDGVAAACGYPGQCVPTGGESGPCWWAACTQNGRPTEQQPRCHKAYVYGCSEFPLQHLRDTGVVEVSDDGVGCPGHSNYCGEGSQAEDCPGALHQPSLDSWVAQTVCAASSQEEEEESQTSQHQADTDEASGRLKLRRQVEQSIVKLTLQLTGVLADARHPQTFPEHLHDH